MFLRIPGPSDAPYSEAVVLNDVIYTAGQIGRDETGAFPPDFETQVRIALDNLKRVVEQCGGSLQSTAKVMVYLARAEDFEALNHWYRELFGDIALPARSTVITALAAPDLLVEIEAIARVVEPAKPA